MLPWLRTCGLALAIGVLIGVAPSGEAAKKAFLYIHNRGTVVNEIWGFEVDGAGQMTAVPGSPAALASALGNCGGHCQTTAYSPKRRMLFASGNGLAGFTVATDGSLAALPGSPFLPGTDLISVAVVDKGKKTFVYATDFNNAQIRGFAVAANGTVTELPGSPFPTAADPGGLSAAGGRLFGSHESGGFLSSFKVKADGSLVQAPGSPLATGADIYNVQADASGKFVYIGDNDADEIRAFSANPQSAALTPLAGSPIPTGIEPDQGTGVAKSALVAQDGTVDGVNDVQVFSRNKKTGALTPTAVQSTGVDRVTTGNVDAAGKLYAVASPTADQVRTFLLDANGTLQPADTQVVILGSPNHVLFIKR